MLQDTVRTKGYQNAILDNKSLFKDKIVLDVGCGSGILSLFAAQAGAKLVIAVDMSSIVEQAKIIAKENDMSEKIVFLRGKLEEVKLPVERVDIIISEWMGYFLLFESMLDSVLFARDKYLTPQGSIFPNSFEMNLFAVSDIAFHGKTIAFWSNVYGFKMNVMKDQVVRDAQITSIARESVVSEMIKFKEIDCVTCSQEEISGFEASFCLRISRDCSLTGLGSSFDTFFSGDKLESKSSFSTSPFHESTHWQQTLFQFDEVFDVKKDSLINGKINCYKNADYKRAYVVVISVFDRVFKYKVE
jgi:2-polyprenyl-3-methyl-5-hydroxy-6-metoxy-1,4-benzoquinol methylase